MSHRMNSKAMNVRRDRKSGRWGTFPKRHNGKSVEARLYGPAGSGVKFSWFYTANMLPGNDRTDSEKMDELLKVAENDVRRWCRRGNKWQEEMVTMINTPGFDYEFYREQKDVKLQYIS